MEQNRKTPKKNKREIYFYLVAAMVILLSIVFIPKRISKYSERPHTNEPLWFIKFDMNKIDYSSAPNLADRFTEAVNLAQEQNQPLTILHIGDSHVQADVFTGETRRLLAAWLNDDNCARGITFPHAMVGSNNPDDFTATSQGQWQRVVNSPDVGIFGVSALSKSTNNEFTLTLNNSSGSLFNRVRIFFNSNEPLVFPYLKGEGTLIERSINSATYSLTNPSKIITIGSNSQLNSGELWLHGIELDNNLSKLKYHSAGVNGATVATFLKSSRFAQQVGQLTPNFVIISLGTNDVYNPAFRRGVFKRNLKKLINTIKAASPNTIIILTTPGDHLINGTDKNNLLKTIERAIKDVAKTEHCGVWDFYNVMGGDGSINLWAEKGLCARDMLHLNRKGYRLQGALLFEAITKLYYQTKPQTINEQLMGNE